MYHIALRQAGCTLNMTRYKKRDIDTTWHTVTYSDWNTEITWWKECLAVVSFQLYTIYLKDKVLGDHTIDIELIWHMEEMREGNEEEEEKDIDIEENRKHLALVSK